ncbi:glycoside hydrolase family 2 TIM barrel-domain containing protein [Christiangramia forsetii]|uniref:Glycosyl hydrolase, family 2-likely beta-galactosidase n=2 Tax=Christiangramia forsetii TaxID=411153 RepID=A0LXC7_CHRFK|nr:glycoside hydrolase family 2 TIM barrel-domain containing protein [Christiangramia forsetii]GGG27571.1 beta-galactosidase [Christiangramia forsetii]CAL65022.1 glycosyl hydrolase, family 2-likely beta-galactosidase [Christiangramia forsetii KT0803]
MKFPFLRTSILILCLAFCLPVLAQRNLIELQKDWKFAKGEIPTAAETNFNDSNWQDVRIPHDWAISENFIKDGDGSTGKLQWKGQGWYRKKLDIAPSFKDKRVYLIFDGVMAFPEVYINGKLAGKWDYGYNSFYVDITDHLNFNGENFLAVHADTRKHDSRWYPGAGMYRKVQMLVTNPVHVDIWGTYVTTPVIKKDSASIRISNKIINTTEKADSVKIYQSILNPEGNEVSKDSVTRFIAAGGESFLEINTKVSKPQLWDVNQPNLYKTITKVFVGGKQTDEKETTFGIRTIKFTADDGFHLNGKRVQLKGVNLHHGHGPLGGAFYPRAAERQLEIMQSLGVNAIRNSHNVAAPELLELCDKMGILFFNEIFDKYDAKAGIVDTTNFEDFAHRNIKNFVLRDRNHPSVFMWSVGNEIGDVQWNQNNGFQRLHTMLNYVNKYDPTRPTTLVNDQLKSAELRHFDLYDVHSWNYGRRYRIARKLEPNKAVVISESASTLSTRGFYEFPLPEKKTDFTKSLQVSSYDLNAPDWAEIADDDFMWQQQEPYIAGEFVWTGFDYLGEPTPYTNKEVTEMGMTDLEASRSSYFGIVDLVGIPKDRYYLYKSYWKPDETTVHILPHWNWEGREGETTPVFVYTNGDCAELFINGKSFGKKCKKLDSETSTDRFRLMWKDVTYEPGEVKAVAYKDGKKIGENNIKTAGKTSKISLTADRTSIKADGKDLSYILVEAFDKDGNPSPLADNELKIEVSGAGHLAGAGNGDPQSFEPFQNNKVNLFYGKAMIIVGSDFEKGKLKLSVKPENIQKESITINVE